MLDAIEALGFRCDGRALALNSYENRQMYQIGIEDAEPVVAKFYRPERWSRCGDPRGTRLCRRACRPGNPGGCPIAAGGRIDACAPGFSLAPYFPGAAGAGRNWATAMSANGSGGFSRRIHAVGRARRFSERGSLNMDALGRDARDFVLRGDWMPDYLATKYAEVTDELLAAVEARAQEVGAAPGLGASWATATAAIFCGPI